MVWVAFHDCNKLVSFEENLYCHLYQIFKSIHNKKTEMLYLHYIHSTSA